MDGLEREVMDGIKDIAKDWGLKVTKFWITDLAEHRVFRLMIQDTPATVLPEEISGDE